MSEAINYQLLTIITYKHWKPNPSPPWEALNARSEKRKMGALLQSVTPKWLSLHLQPPSWTRPTGLSSSKITISFMFAHRITHHSLADPVRWLDLWTNTWLMESSTWINLPILPLTKLSVGSRESYEWRKPVTLEPWIPRSLVAWLSALIVPHVW